MCTMLNWQLKESHFLVTFVQLFVHTAVHPLFPAVLSMLGY